MPRTIIADGKKVVVPDDATDEEINQIVGPVMSAGPADLTNRPNPPGTPNTSQYPFPDDQMSRLLGKNPVSDAAGVVGDHLKSMVVAPYRAVTDAPTGTAEKVASYLGPAALPAYRMFVKPSVDALGTAVSQYKAGNLTKPEYDAQGNYQPNAVGSVMDAVPLAGGWARQVENDAHKHGALAATLGLATDLLTPYAAERGSGALARGVGTAARAPFAGGINDVIPGTSITPAARYAAAQRLGVNLDLADATNSTAAKSLKAIGRDSLVGSGVYDKAKATNIAALGNATDAAVNSMSPLDREMGGARTMDLLKQDQSGQLNAAQASFNDLTTRVGKVATPLTNTKPLALSILNEEAPYIAAHPELAPGKPWSIVKDLAGVSPNVPKFEYGVPAEWATTTKARPFGDPPTTFADAQKLRSDVMDVYQNNPDIVKTRAQGWMQRSVGALDDDMTSQLSGDDLKQFRAANQWYKDAKTYDDPSSPLYHAVRTPTPSTLPATLSGTTPEGVRALQPRIGDEGLGILQRGKAEKLLGTTPGSEEYNFRSFPTQFSRMPEDYGQQLFGPKLDTLRDISNTSHALSADFNPSGTAKQAQKYVEAGAILPTGGAPLLQYPLARFMNSPAVVNYMMRDALPVPASSKLLPSLSTPKTVIPALTLSSRRNGTR